MSTAFNEKLLAGIPPSIVGQIVGHSLKVMETFYKNIEVRERTEDLIKSRFRNLQDNDFETVTPTTDDNPNIQTDKIAKLRPRKVPASEIFNQTTDNPINEADDCQPQQYRDKKNKRSRRNLKGSSNYKKKTIFRHMCRYANISRLWL